VKDGDGQRERLMPVPARLKLLVCSLKSKPSCGERAGPKRPCEERCRPPRCRAWLRDDKVSPNEAGFDLREIPPLPRNNLHNCRKKQPGLPGSRAKAHGKNQ